jgi:hypothetical protein
VPGLHRAADEGSVVNVDARYWRVVREQHDLWWARNVVREEYKPGDWLTPEKAIAWLEGEGPNYGYVC